VVDALIALTQRTGTETVSFPGQHGRFELCIDFFSASERNLRTFKQEDGVISVARTCEHFCRALLRAAISHVIDKTMLEATVCTVVDRRSGCRGCSKKNMCFLREFAELVEFRLVYFSVDQLVSFFLTLKDVQDPAF
jgi:hypothetical protein